MFRRKRTGSVQTESIDTLIIVGNGFDIWQGLYTDYGEFEKYYLANRDRILQKLGLTKSWSITHADYTSESFSDVEMIYGNPFDPGELDSDFWYTFEDSLRRIDSEQLNLFFGKEDDNLDDLSISITNAQAILREAFCDWISTIQVNEKETGFHFGPNCFFINFNYTDTLEKRFGIPQDRIFHIHGEASQKDSIIFGHSLHPQLPVEFLNELGGRFRGLYLIEKLLYETDKHAYIHYLELLVCLAARGIKLSGIKQIYVLGHSFGPADFEYFKELSAVFEGISAPEEFPHLSSLDSTDVLHHMIGHVILTYGNDGPHPEFDAATANAVSAEVYRSQRAIVRKSIQKQYRRTFSNRRKYPHRLRNLEDVFSVSLNSTPPKWHITYHSDKDKDRIENTIRTVGISRYQLYNRIDNCLEPFQHTT